MRWRGCSCGTSRFPCRPKGSDVNRGAGYRRRAVTSRVMLLLTCASALLVIGCLLVVLGYVLAQGSSALSIAFFTETPRPVGEPGGGMANALAGTLILITLACLVGLPLGIGAGVYLAEYGRETRLAALVRFTAEMLRLVPDDLRQAGLALGIPRYKIVLWILLPSALGGVVTGVMLAIARAAGETAPLLFTAFGNRFWSWDMAKPIAALPLQIFAYAISPYEDW